MNKALESFVTILSNISRNLEILNEYVGSHMNTDPDEVNWGHVGSATYLNSMLEQITESFGLGEENKRKETTL